MRWYVRVLVAEGAVFSALYAFGWLVTWGKEYTEVGDRSRDGIFAAWLGMALLALLAGAHGIVALVAALLTRSWRRFMPGGAAGLLLMVLMLALLVHWLVWLGSWSS